VVALMREDQGAQFDEEGREGERPMVGE